MGAAASGELERDARGHGRRAAPAAAGRRRGRSPRSTTGSSGRPSRARRTRSSPAPPRATSASTSSARRSCAGSPTPSSSTDVTVVNFHIDGDREQFDRVLALAPERSIVAGDANLVSPVADGFSQPLAGSIDQILVRGLELRDGPSAWPVERRTVDGRVLSDHAPVEAVVGVTFEEARAQFPVLERYAYLNAGSSGPLPRAAVDACVRGSSAISTEGRSGKAYIEGMLRAAGARPRRHRGRPRHLRRSSSRSPTRRRAAARSSLAGLGLGRDDEVVTTDQEHFGLTRPAPRERRPRRRRGGGRGRAPRRGHAAHAADRRLARPLDDRAAGSTSRGSASRTGRRCSSTARSRPARSRSISPAPTSTPCQRPEMAVRARSVGRALRPRSGAAARGAAERVLAAELRDRRLVRAEGRRARGSTPAGSARRRSPASSPRSACIRSGATSAPPPTAARCRELLAPLVEVVTPPGHSTLVSFRPPAIPPSSSRRSPSAA